MILIVIYLKLCERTRSSNDYPRRCFAERGGSSRLARLLSGWLHQRFNLLLLMLR